MRICVCLLVLSLTLLMASCKEKRIVQSTSEVVIIPEPFEIRLQEGVFEFNRDLTIFIEEPQNLEFELVLKKEFNDWLGFEPQINKNKPNANYIHFKLDKRLKKEAYKLNVDSKYVTIEGGDSAGLTYGLISFLQLLPNELGYDKKSKISIWNVPKLTILDEPRYPWRGVMLDVARHFFPKEYILKTMDQMVRLKLNTLHLHLVDDQGWRIEIKKFPKLTEIGGFRVGQEERHWNARLTNQIDSKPTYGGYYTQEDIKGIIEYAKKRGITVIPEIEMPAHVSSALAAYPEFSCFGDTIAVPSGGVWPITDIYCAGKDQTFEFLEDVLTEVMALFPSKYIHIGGDEATRTNWEKCPHCQSRMLTEDLANTAQLQSYFIKRMERFISSKNRTLIGWDEILEGGLADNATVMSWRGIKGGWEATEMGHDVVMTPGQVYFNQYQGDPDSEPVAFGGYEPISAVYSFDPVIDSMSIIQKKHVLGSQANLWSEFITNEEISEYMLYPRLAALSEALWTPKSKKNWTHFSEKIPILFKRYDAQGVNYARSVYDVTAQGRFTSSRAVKIGLKSEIVNSDIRYVLNTEDFRDSLRFRYGDSLIIKKTTVLHAAVMNDNLVLGDTLKKNYLFHKGIGKQIEYKPVYNEKYSGQGHNTLLNVIRGSKNFHDGQWLAWLVDDTEIIINLQEAKDISSITIGSMEDQGSGIYFPKKISVSLSLDGQNFHRVGEKSYEHKDSGNVKLKNFVVPFEKQSTQLLKIKIFNLAHPPKGGDAWMFLDEIVID